MFTDSQEQVAADRQPAEPLPWYRRFLLYRDLGPRRRLATAYQSGQRRRSADVPASWLDAFDRWRWRQRALDWDAEQLAAAATVKRETAERERLERVGLLKGARAKIITVLQRTDGTSDDFGPLVSQIATITEQLRKESDE